MTGDISGGEHSSVEQLERVRDILFGSSVRELKRDVTRLQEQLAELSKEQQRLRQTLQDQEKAHQEKLEAQQKALEQTVAHEIADMRQRLDEKQRHLTDTKVDRQGLAGLLGELARQLGRDEEPFAQNESETETESL